MNLEPLQRSLLDSVRAEVQEQERLEAAAATEQLREARARADAMAAEGRLEGERAAMRETARIHAAAVRTVRESRLRAQRALVDELCSRVRDAVLELRDAPGYEQLLDRLAKMARDQLGPDAELERDPPGVGGVLARAGSRSVDYTLATLATRMIEGLGESLEALWQ